LFSISVVIVNYNSDRFLKDNISKLVPAVRRALEEAEEYSKRKKAEEKLKEINIAYAEIRALLSGGRRTHRKKQTVQWLQGAFKVVCKNTLAFKEIACDFCSFARIVLRKSDFRQIFRQIFLHSHTLEEAAHRKNQTPDGFRGRAGRMEESRDRHRKFKDVYEEVERAKTAKAKKAE